MKVDNQYPPPSLKEKGISKGREKESVAQKPPDYRKAVELKNGSASQFTVNKMREAIDAAGDINHEKVEALRAKIKSGAYRVDTEKLAQNMIKNSIVEDI